MEVTGELLLEACDKARPFVRHLLSARPDTVEDVLQDACVKALRYASTFEGRSQFSTWFCSIARNEAYMLLRKRVNAGLDDAHVDYWVDTKPNPETAIIKKDRRENLSECISLLSPKLRSAIIDWAAKEFRVGTDSSSTKARIHRAKKELRVMMGVQ
jgi:RNA polymerase sigma factor (sigma-70 family)